MNAIRDVSIATCIHTYAGIQLRNACADIMEMQGYEEPTGQAKITPGYNLPCKYVLHTVGPIVQGQLTKEHEELLASCYRSCLELAEKNGVKSIAFCCISTGVFMFPNERAAEIAVHIVKEYRKEYGNGIEVILQERVFRLLQDLHIAESVLRSISRNLGKSMVLRICTPVASILMRLRKRCGLIGRSSSSLIDSWMRRNLCMSICFLW